VFDSDRWFPDYRLYCINTYTHTKCVSISGTGLVTANAGTYTLQTNAAGCTSAVSSNIVVNAQPATPSAPTAGTVTQPTCATATGSFQITGYSASILPFTPSGGSAERFGNWNDTLHKLMQQVVLRQRHQVLLLMHNPLPPAAQQQEQLRSQHVQQQQQFQITNMPSITILSRKR
jgi:hypothetical protein